nr:hypothetical protein Iba_chr06cCG13800 [Ipomoea batatas]
MLSPEKGNPPRSSVVALRKGNLRQLPPRALPPTAGTHHERLRCLTEKRERRDGGSFPSLLRFITTAALADGPPSKMLRSLTGKTWEKSTPPEVIIGAAIHVLHLCFDYSSADSSTNNNKVSGVNDQQAPCHHRGAQQWRVKAAPANPSGSRRPALAFTMQQHDER